MGFLRLILAIAVVIAHSGSLFGFRFTGGLVAVEVFFIISGFYMTMILDKKYVGKGSYALFLSNRFLRLYPIFWVVLLLTIVASISSYVFVGNWLKLSPYIQYITILKPETILFQIATNIALFGQDLVMFLGVSKETGEMYFTHDFRISSPMFYEFLFVPQAWTLGVELVFYLMAPFIVRRSNLFIVFLITLSISVRAFTYFYLGYINDPWTYRFFPSELALFLLGTVSYRLYDRYKIQDRVVLGFDPSKVIVSLFFLILVFYQYIPHIVGWVFYGFCCLSIPFVFKTSRSSKIDSRIGELSYPIYISHILVIKSISPLLSLLGASKYKGEFSVIFTIVASYILVRFISDPIEVIRQSRARVIVKQ